MGKIIFFLAGLCFAITACTKEKTDYRAEIEEVVTEHYEFKEAVQGTVDGYDIQIEALNGTLYTGYNKIRVKITDQQHNSVPASSVTFLPLLQRDAGEPESGPHRYQLIHQADKAYFSGYAVFTEASRIGQAWTLYIGFLIEGQEHRVRLDAPVQEQPNKNLNMTSFEGNDGAHYRIALVAPQKPQVAENELIAGIYKFNQPQDPPSDDFPDPTRFSYTEVQGFTLKLDPRMPEPSMGNHSSPNNRDLKQHDDGLYHGVVNYTMTGNWTLNFILRNEQGQVLKGTEVPRDFTPGVPGVKSELYIDILF